MLQNLVTAGSSRPGAWRPQRSQRQNFDLVLLNSSGKPQLMAALQCSLVASIFLCQEHHAGGPNFVDLKHEAKQLGWTVEGASACRMAREGWSAGVVVVAKAGIGIGNVAGSFDHSLDAARGRLAAASCHAACLAAAASEVDLFFGAEGSLPLGAFFCSK